MIWRGTSAGIWGFLWLRGSREMERQGSSSNWADIGMDARLSAYLNRLQRIERHVHAPATSLGFNSLTRRDEQPDRRSCAVRSLSLLRTTGPSRIHGQ